MLVAESWFAAKVIQVLAPEPRKPNDLEVEKWIAKQAKGGDQNGSSFQSPVEKGE